MSVSSHAVGWGPRERRWYRRIGGQDEKRDEWKRKRGTKDVESLGGDATTHTLDSLVQHNLGLVQLLLDVRNGVDLAGVLVRPQVPLEGRERDVAVVPGGGDLGGGLVREELVDDL